MNNEYHKAITENTTLYSYCPKCGTVRFVSRCIDMVIINNKQGELMVGQSTATDECLTCGHRYNSFKITE